VRRKGQASQGEEEKGRVGGERKRERCRGRGDEDFNLM
jgi:hypothetical protein